MKFLSWDAAYKTLAWSHISVDVHIFSKIGAAAESFANMHDRYFGKNITEYTDEHRALMRSAGFLDELSRHIQLLNGAIDNFICIHNIGAADILDDRNVSSMNDVQRTKSLHKFLHERDFGLTDETVIIEHQSSKIGTKVNNKSTMVAHQLMYHFNNREVVTVNPRLKNNISLSPDLTFEKFLDAETTRKKSRGGDTESGVVYPARKKHARANFLHLLATFDIEHVIADVPRACLKDVADATMQVLAYICTNKLWHDGRKRRRTNRPAMVQQ